MKLKVGACGMLSQQTTVFMERAFINPESTTETCFPNIYGKEPVKNEPIEKDVRHNWVNGNVRSLDRNNPTRFVKMTSSDRKLRGPIVTMVDSTAPNVCQICGKWFRSRQQVAQHLLVHTDERRYKCTYCDRAFKQASHLQQHHRIHTGEKPYRCPLQGCTRAFPQLSNLNHHLRNHDKPDPPVANTCAYCKRVYASEAVLKTHLEKIHSCKEEVEGNCSADTTNSTSKEKPKQKFHASNNNYIKIAPSQRASMTVTPPVLNFSQAFLSPYVHELNLVQLPVNLVNYASFPVDSKMVLPVSMPVQNGNQDGSTKYRSSDTSHPGSNMATYGDSKTLLSYSNVSAAQEKYVRDNIPSEEKSPSNELDRKPIVFKQHTLNSQKYQSFIKSEPKDEPTDDKRGAESDSDNEFSEKYTEIDHDNNETLKRTVQYNYSYTLDGVTDDHAEKLVKGQGQKDVMAVQEATEKYIKVLESYLKSASSYNITNKELNDSLKANKQPINVATFPTSFIKTEVEIVEEDPAPLGVNGNYPSNLPGNEAQELTDTTPWEIQSEICRGDINGSPRVDTSRESTEQLKTHSRKRKAFRPQRVVHEKMFVKDYDVHI